MDLSRLAFIDVETTGSSPLSDRVIEIAILCVDNNKVTTEYSTLINPERPFSPFIESITGISPRDVRTAPTFEDVYPEVHMLLDGRVFVAHNVQFDYSFLKAEFLRFGISFSSERLCTVKLSRHFYPRFLHHNLDSIIQRFNLTCEQRHRALSDTRAMWQFFQKVQKEHPSSAIMEACITIAKRPTLPPHLETEIIQKLPEKPGVYLFYDKNSACLYIGKSNNIKDRVFSHFANSELNGREAEMNDQVTKVEFRETTGEFGALLLESALIKDIQPIYNRRLRKHEEVSVITQKTNSQGYCCAQIKTVPIEELSDTSNILLFAKTKLQAKKKLENIGEKYLLCKKLLGLEKTKGGCFDHKLGICMGACEDKEPPEVYNLKFQEAFVNSRIPTWPYKSPICIDEKDPTTSRGEKHIFDQWRYFGSIRWDDTSTDYLLSKDKSFDYDTYLILKHKLTTTAKIQPISYSDLEQLQQS